MYDDWELEAPEAYSQNKFYTKATDGRGHSENVQVKLSPNIIGALSSIVQSKGIPEYRTIQDIIRDAVVHRLHYLYSSGVVHGVNSLVRWEIAIQEMLEYQQRAMAFETVVKQAVQTANDLRRFGPEGIEKAKKIARDLYAELMQLTDDPFWRKRYLDEIAKNLSDLIEDV